VSNYTGAAPDSPRKADWRDNGLCRQPEYQGHADMWFATVQEKFDRDQAEQVCRACPAVQDCAVWAVLTGIQHGTWGALHEEQRTTLRKRLSPEQRTDPTAVTAAVHQALHGADSPQRTLHTIWAERTQPLPGGHLEWTGKQSVVYGGRPYTKKQVAFYTSRGRMPVGIVRRTCEVEECVLPAHIADGQERARQVVEEALRNTAVRAV
jgi:hypothetical protein